MRGCNPCHEGAARRCGPADAYVAVKYRVGYWIDDREEPTKAAFSNLMFMLALTETSGAPTGAPVLTVPAR